MFLLFRGLIVYTEAEEKIITCLKRSKDTFGWLTLLKDKNEEKFYFMGYAGMGSTIINEINPKFENLIKTLIDEKKLLIDDSNYYSYDYNRYFVLYDWSH